MAAGNLQIGADTFTDTRSFGYVFDGALGTITATAGDNTYLLGSATAATRDFSIVRGTVALGTRPLALKVTRAGNYKVTWAVEASPLTTTPMFGLVETFIVKNGVTTVDGAHGQAAPDSR